MPAAELDKLLAFLSDADRELVNRCYRLDTNYIPGRYILLPVSTIVPEPVNRGGVWWELQVRLNTYRCRGLCSVHRRSCVCDAQGRVGRFRGTDRRRCVNVRVCVDVCVQVALLTALRRAVESSDLSDAEREKWLVSVTDQEVLRTRSFVHDASPEVRDLCVHDDSVQHAQACACVTFITITARAATTWLACIMVTSSSQMLSRSFCFRRTITGLDPADRAARLYVDTVSSRVDEDAQVCCRALLRCTARPVHPPSHPPTHPRTHPPSHPPTSS